MARERARSATQVVGYYFKPDVRLSLMRSQNCGETQRVPEVAIFATKKKLRLSSLEEGFDELYSVRCGAHNDFVVSSLRPR
jgi:hypothetical protein